MKAIITVVVLALAAPLSASANCDFGCPLNIQLPQRDRSQDVQNQLRDIRSDIHYMETQNYYRDMYGNSF